jgi:hypothetical protein
MKDKNLQNEQGGLQKIETENIVARQQFSADCGYRLMGYDRQHLTDHIMLYDHEKHARHRAKRLWTASAIILLQRAITNVWYAEFASGLVHQQFSEQLLVNSRQCIQIGY